MQQTYYFARPAQRHKSLFRPTLQIQLQCYGADGHLQETIDILSLCGLASRLFTWENQLPYARQSPPKLLMTRCQIRISRTRSRDTSADKERGALSLAVTAVLSSATNHRTADYDRHEATLNTSDCALEIRRVGDGMHDLVECASGTCIGSWIRRRETFELEDRKTRTVSATLTTKSLEISTSDQGAPRDIIIFSAAWLALDCWYSCSP
ncbi:hypothetical protein F4778DRAFT_783813 [Xylariomycetidae sp. FL2044]|nr:hypothetical protein F4778DRAFT_783813 [Xylariomycetidae sp. FL2044]